MTDSGSMAATPTMPPVTEEPAAAEDAKSANRYVLGVVAFVLLSITVGRAWDAAWHTTHRFDDFFSPPHIFIYACVALAMAIYARLLSRPEVSRWFGTPHYLPKLHVPVPGPLLMLGGGLAVIGLAGVFDGTWHTLFGLDETNWSTPHAMLGWGICLTVLGYVSCRMALHEVKPVNDFVKVVMGLLCLYSSTAPLMGPIGQTAGPAITRAVARIPVLLADPNAQHSFRVLLHYNLNRTNPFFVVLAALWAVAVVAFLLRMDRRLWFMPVVAATATFFQLGRGGPQGEEELAYVLPLPVAVAAVVAAVVLLLRGTPRLAWLIAGLATGLATFAGWGRTDDAGLALALVAVAPFAGWAGAALAGYAWRAVSEPTPRRAGVFLAVTGLGVPLATGAIDLYMRNAVP